MQSSNLTNHFLIAMPSLADPNFHHTVTYICAHNEEGAMGIIINRPLGLELSEILEQMELKTDDKKIARTPIYHGGPVQSDRGFVLHQPLQQWDSSITVSNKIGVATSRDILKAIAEGKGPDNTFIALGYAGWGAGQLEQEIRDNAWLSGPADLGIIFNMPNELRWSSAAALMGVDIEKISGDVGHA